MKDTIANQQIIECMTLFLITVGKYDTLATAYEKMTSHKIRRIPVVDHDRLVGIITLSDILRFQPAEIRRYLSFKELSTKLDEVIVDLVMNPEPIVVYQTDQVGYAAELMLDNKIGGLPVLDASQKLVGLITESDLFRLLAREWRESTSSQH